MQVAQFPASAVKSLIDGYCDDFVSLAAVLAQTLEQVSMRGLPFDTSRPALERVENGMRALADAIHDMLDRGGAASGAADRRDGSSGAGAVDRRDGATGTPRGTASGGAGTAASPQRAAAPKPAATPPARAGAPQTGGTAGAASPAGSAAFRPAPSAPAAPGGTGSHGNSTPAAAAAGSRAGTSGPLPTATGAPAPNPAAAGSPTGAGARPPVSAAGPHRAAAPRSPSEGLRGTNESMPLLSVFQFLGRMRKAGTMRVELGEEQITFDLQNGCLLSTTSTLCPWQERLGELLVETEACAPEALAPIVAKVGAGAIEPFGQLAVAEGIVTTQQVITALELQVNLRFSRACKATTCSYEFVEGVRPPLDQVFRIRPVPIA